MKKIYLLFLLLLGLVPLRAQTVLTTGVPNATTTFFGSAPFILTFTITNNNSYPIDITNIDIYRGSTSNGTTFSLYYNATSLSGTTTFSAPGWTFITSATTGTVASSAIYPTFSGFTFTMPANTTYRFMQACSGASIVCGGTTATPNNWSSGGVTIGAGNYQINGSNVGYAASGSSTPYFWAGTITFAPAVPCTSPPIAGTATVSNAFPCQGSGIVLNATGNTGGLGQTYQWQTSPSATGPFTNLGTSQTAAYLATTATATLYYRMLVTCSGNTDSTLPILVTIPTPFPGGTYTIDNTQPTGGSNFNSFADAALAINCGISGAITFNVAPGTYNNDFFRLDNYVNSAGTTITINGNNATLSNVSSSPSEPGIIRLNGTKRVTINNLRINGISNSTSQYAWGVFLTNNADSNTITNCIITLDTTVTSTNYAGIVLSGSATSPTTTGSGCDANTISNNIVKGGYYGITLMGNSGVNILQNNVVSNNIVKDFYVYGIYASYSNNMLIENNDVSRPSRTSVTTFGPIYMTTGHSKLNINKNRIHDPAAGNPQASFTGYGIYISGAASLNNENIVSNNLIYNLQGGGTGVMYGLYNSTGGYTRYFYNTISNDFTASTGTGNAHGFYQTGSTTNIQLKNNNISVTRGGTGSKYGIFMNTAATTITSDYNNVYVNGAAGTNNFGQWNGAVQVSLANWVTASSQDVHSVSVDPLFINPVVGNFVPTNGSLDNLGTPITGITTDITGAARSVTTPDIGAYEFAVAPCSNIPAAGIVSGPVSACPGANFMLNLTGYTIGTGISIQWESSPAGISNFQPILGATSPSFSANQTTATDYRAVVTCSNGGGSDVSGTYTVQVDPFYICYCSPYTGVSLHTGSVNYITNVSIPNTTLNNSSTGASAGSYTRTDFTIPSNTATISQTTQYTINVSVLSASYTAVVWVDYDQNGTFDASEFTQLTTTGTVSTGSLVIPLTAQLGLTGMRVRVYATTSYGASGACSQIATGYETEDYVITVAGPPACQQPSGFSTANLTANSVDVSWTAISGAGGYEYYYSTSATPPTSGTPATGNTVPLTGLTPSTQYYFFVRTDCGTNGYSLWSTYSFTSGAVNDNPWTAIPVTVGATCSGSPYTNIGGTLAAGEPWPTCAGTGGYHSVWYSFVAPTSGAVKISTDFSGGTMSTDSRLALYSTTNVNDYTAFTILACDDDNGSVVSIRSIIYYTGLTSGTTYYIQVDEFDPVTQTASSYPGTFCMEVTELNSTMLSTGGSCAAGQSFTTNLGYTGKSALVDASGNLIAIVKNTGATGGTYGTSITTNTAAVRSSGGQYYMDRNYLISGPAGNHDLQLFFLASELTALQGVDPTATMSSLNVTRQTGTTCTANFTAASGTNSGLTQVSNGSAGTASWVQVVTPGFSNFFIQSGTPLVIKLGTIAATNFGSRNRLDWTTESEAKGDKFEIEHSADGKNFTYLATVIGKGERSAYSYWDEAPFTGINHYRLKLMDESGSTSYSKVVTAMVKEGMLTVEAFPNPVQDVLTVKVHGRTADNALVQITDLTGKVIKASAVSNGEANIKMNNIAAGLYLVKYSDDKHSQTIKINKK